jgi:hypothetical protein
MTHYSLFAWTTQPLVIWQICAAISCAERTTCRLVFKLGHALTGGMTRSAISLCCTCIDDEILSNHSSKSLSVRMALLVSTLNTPVLMVTPFSGINHAIIKTGYHEPNSPSPRFAADVFTEGLMLLARSINPSAPTLFHAPLSPHAKSYKPPRSAKSSAPPTDLIDTLPKKLEWTLTPELRVGIRFAETRLSDLICQNDCQALEFKGYGKNFITSHGFSPDAFVQMAFQAAYFGLYGSLVYSTSFFVVSYLY